MSGNELNIGEIATYIPGSLEIFEKYQIDFYRKGGRSLEMVCKTKGLDPSVIEAEINHAEKERFNSMEGINDWKISQIIDHIQYRHHSTEKFALHRIAMLITKISSLSDDPLISFISETFNKLHTDLEKHSEEEEHELFPYLKRLEEAEMQKSVIRELKYILHQPIKILEAEHEETEVLIEKIRSITNNYEQSQTGDYNELMKELALFERDFHLHIHLENNILFPRAIELENRVKQKALA
jgi:regulator of cell morphogenesis and NO signaling